MKKFTNVLAIAILAGLMIAPIMAQPTAFDRAAQIDADTLDVGGFGNIIAGEDFDGDGKVEIYAVNNDWHDQIGFDLVPRIYKYEQTLLGDWVAVWSTRLPFEFQNTWPALAVADLDEDGKKEIVWGPVNNFGGGSNPNPIRIAVFETAGDGSDNMGVDNGDGTWAPNASWTITSADNENLRPFRWHIIDIDDDNTFEIVAYCRVGDGIQIYSVDDVPDNGGGTETWTSEFSGVAGTHYDGFVMAGKAYGINSVGDVTSVSWDGSAYVEGTPQVGIVGAGSWNSASLVDVDRDGNDEVVVASWSSSTSAVYLLQQSGDTLKSTLIADVPDENNRLYGGVAGDTDNDDKMDFLFGTRSAAVNATIFRLEYKGDGAAIDDPASYVLSSIDSLVNAAQQYDVFAMADMDGDIEGDQEVLYTGTPRGLAATDAPQPITILNDNGTRTGIFDDRNVAEGFELKQNYPNPFNPETSIQFEIPSALDVRINIYNALGQKVRSLLNENRGPGVHTVKWDGRSNDGSRVASGMYIYSMTAGNITLTKRMTLLK
ncbi:MAG: FG-GAP-like repeat-containing protein [Calditrichia bacterium]